MIYDLASITEHPGSTAHGEDMYFKGVILVGGVPEVNIAGTMDSFLHHLRNGFESMGMTATHLRLAEEPIKVISATVDRFRRSGKPFFLLDLNGGLGRIDALPHFSLMVDHPLTHPVTTTFGSNAVLGVIDEGHAAVSGYTKAETVFVPHGGPPLADAPLPWAERDVDIVFPGTIPIDTALPIGNLLRPLNELMRDAATAAVERVLDGDQEPFAALEAALHERGSHRSEVEADVFAEALRVTESYAQCVTRELVLNKLSGLNVHVIGPRPDAVQARLPQSFTYHGGKDLAFVIDKIRRSKMTLNVSHKYSRGAHERIWLGMANNSVAITQENSFMSRDFTHDKNMLFYRKTSLDAGYIGDLLNSSQQLEEMTIAAREPYQARHTWERRARTIVMAMDRHVLRSRATR